MPSPVPFSPRSPFVLLDDATAAPDNAASRLYTDFAREDVIPCGGDGRAPEALDALLSAGWAENLHATLFAPYEFGGALVDAPVHVEPVHVRNTLPFHDGALRLLWFRTLQHMTAPDVGAWLASVASPEPAGAIDVHSDTPWPAYEAAIARIHDWIEAGDTYQVNFTQRLRFSMFGDPVTLHAGLRAAQPVPYGVLAHLPGDRWVSSLSPELFVAHDGHGHLLARPMKGTAPRAADGDANPDADAEIARALAADPKNRAENVMIVDLLRNDLGRVAVPGSVKVPDLFAVAPFGRVWQMTSTVTADARAGTRFGDLMGALFPCGSITGAPKRRTMEIIAALESSPRGLYTGAVGWLDADGAFAMSVAIRTLVLDARGRDGLRRGEMGVGGGIVHDSVAHDEYVECAWKARFLTAHDPGFTLFETMHARDGVCLEQSRHLARLSQAAAAFGFAFDADAAARAVAAEAAGLGDGDWRLRVSVNKIGTLAFASGALVPLTEPVFVDCAAEPLPDADPLRRYKTSARAVYDAGWQSAEQRGAFDRLFFNTRGELLEGGRTSVFARIDGEWLTPPLSSDILPGVMRAVMLEQGHPLLTTPAREAPITRAMLTRAQQIVVCNALRGAMVAVLKD
ncbi:chorismate-binding protein [Cupriavidus plantarum]|uniref:chorismate-binding protein n=1 Tax=Cupriavidus plantarum TaxID=942865 RepID=UPI000EAC6DEF|nr:bifunctional anthranilate synthase component I family protein/class IV aminotransferase [Cupriavidus plantarum]RLK44212.1 para-aminobenzoate synthetase/4-amino-4-deoxychorismate lyase [Cupriavidus plantarum]